MKRIMSNGRRAPGNGVKGSGITHFINRRHIIRAHPASLTFLNPADIVPDDLIGNQIPLLQKDDGAMHLLFEPR